MGILTSGFVLRRLKKLEQTLQVDNLEVTVDIVFWDGVKGGLFGHVRERCVGNGGKIGVQACSAEEEIELMKEAYERDGHRVFGKGDEVSFAGYLDYFCYLGPEALATERKAVIERLRGEVNGA